MALVVNGVTIPQNGGIIYNGVDLDKVVCNGVTVWEKTKAWIAADENGWYGDAVSTNSANKSSLITGFTKSGSGCIGGCSVYDDDVYPNQWISVDSGWLPTYGCKTLNVTAVIKTLTEGDFSDWQDLVITGYPSTTLHNSRKYTYELRNYASASTSVAIDVSAYEYVKVQYTATARIDRTQVDQYGKGHAYFSNISFS